MRKWTFILCLIFLLSCNFSEQENTGLDEAARPSDWKSTISMVLELDTTNDEKDEVRVREFTSSQSLNVLVAQLYNLAFSGEAKVYGPGLFGNLDRDRPLEPKELVDELEVYDTVVVEDLYSGELKDTVIDNSFTLQKASALILDFGIASSEEQMLAIQSLAIGVQVFDEATGMRRGHSKRFFMDMETEGTFIGHDHLLIFSDSLGTFRPYSFSVYREESPISVDAFLKQRFNNLNQVQLTFDLSLSFKEGKLKLSNVQWNELKVTEA